MTAQDHFSLETSQEQIQAFVDGMNQRYMEQHQNNFQKISKSQLTLLMSDQDLAYFQCGICRYLLSDPVQCLHCQQPYCSPCINQEQNRQAHQHPDCLQGFEP
mmetsp:Transcript_25214/g.24653  ORF Transcript_25214/g.24653 Transcript_25214/m.24653 type:complete len:103 (+) Transcript_25214:32-340(+)